MGGVASFNYNIINYSKLICQFHSKVILLKAKEDTRADFNDTFNVDEVIVFQYSNSENQYYVQKRLNNLIGNKVGAIVTDNGFDALFAANRIAASVREKARTHPLRLAGLIGNRTSKRDLIDKYVEACPMPVLEVLPLIEDIRISRVKGKTLFEM
jgi:hypothetical protein